MSEHAKLMDAILECEDALTMLKSVTAEAPTDKCRAWWADVRRTYTDIRTTISAIEESRRFADWRAAVAAGQTKVGFEDWFYPPPELTNQ